MIRERDPGNIPIHIAFGSHNTEGVSNIPPLEKIARSYLSAGEGNVVWFIEAVDATLETVHLPFLLARDMQREFGFASHLDARIQLAFIVSRKRPPSAKEFAKEKRAFLEGVDFDAASHRAIDSLSSDYPKRVVMAFEKGATQEDIIEKEASDDRQLQLLTACDRFVLQGRFLEALPFFREGVDIEAQGVNTRDLRLRDSLILSLFVPFDDKGSVITEVGHLGAVHTRVYHMLKKDGYNVSCFFPQKEGSVYLYPPFAVALRARTFFPSKEYNQEDWLKIFVQSEIYVELERRRQASIVGALTDRSSSVKSRLFNALGALLLKLMIRRIPKTEQQLLRVVYEATRDFDEEKIREFGESVKKQGLICSAAQLISQLA